jgi:hypothetical protein
MPIKEEVVSILDDRPASSAGSAPFSGADQNRATEDELRRKSPHKLLAAIACAFAVTTLGVISIFAVNHFNLQTPMNTVLRDDPRNAGVAVSVHYGRYLETSVLVYDLQSVAGTNSAADVFRAFLQFSQKIKEKRFTEVRISYREELKFKLEGAYFQQLGTEYATQNPVYTIRTFPSHLYLPDGTRAYGEWQGGWLGVAMKEMEDFNDFSKQWYLQDYVSGR